MKPTRPTPPRQKKIDHFVVLYMENHAADNFFGCMDLPGFDGAKGHTLPKDPSDPSKGSFEITCGDAPYVCSGGPGYDTYAGKFKKPAQPHKYPYSEQVRTSPPAVRPGPRHDTRIPPPPAAPRPAVRRMTSTRRYTARPRAARPSRCTLRRRRAPRAEATPLPRAHARMRTRGTLARARRREPSAREASPVARASQVPVKAAIAHNFGVFNKLYCAVASASSPNRAPTRGSSPRPADRRVICRLLTRPPRGTDLFTQSATSCGMQSNALYNNCGGKSVSFPQKTIYDSLREHNVRRAGGTAAAALATPSPRPARSPALARLLPPPSPAVQVSFTMFMNSTCGLDGKPCHGEDPITPDSPSAISTPDVAMEGVARYKERFMSQARATPLHHLHHRHPLHLHRTCRHHHLLHQRPLHLPPLPLRLASPPPPPPRRRSSTSRPRRASCPLSRGSTRPSRRATTRAKTSPRASGCSRLASPPFKPKPNYPSPSRRATTRATT